MSAPPAAGAPALRREVGVPPAVWGTGLALIAAGLLGHLAARRLRGGP